MLSWLYGVNCDICEPNWIPEIDSLGTLCRYCKPGFWEGFAKLVQSVIHTIPWRFVETMNGGKKTNTILKCVISRRKYVKTITIAAPLIARVCAIGDDFTGQYCQNDRECNQGTCQFKSCCVESKHGDVSECNRDGYWGPLCEPCPGSTVFTVHPYDRSRYRACIRWR